MDENHPKTGGTGDLLQGMREMNRLQEHALDRIGAAARVDAVVGQPVVAGDRTVLPLAETFYAGGYGGGVGTGSTPSESDANRAASSGGGSGYGGGGTAKARPVAIVEISPDGVRVVPVFDWTSLGIAAVATLGALVMARGRMRRARQATELLSS